MSACNDHLDSDLPVRHSVFDRYVMLAPSPQNALDIFKGEWTSSLPGCFSHLQAGALPLFEDPWVKWAVRWLGGVRGKTVLELGPLEGGHTYILESLGAASIVSVEANTHAYLKCLITKELLQLKRARFLCGDFVEYLRANPGRYDICLASGVLYHMSNPVELVALISRVTNRVYMWTHYYDQERVLSTPDLALRFSGAGPIEYGGFECTAYYHHYDEKQLGWEGFCGGLRPSTCWLSRESILRCLRYFGFNDILVGYEDPNHSHGPAFALVAAKRLLPILTTIGRAGQFGRGLVRRWRSARPQPAGTRR